MDGCGPGALGAGTLSFSDNDTRRNTRREPSSAVEREKEQTYPYFPDLRANPSITCFTTAWHAFHQQNKALFFSHPFWPIFQPKLLAFLRLHIYEARVSGRFAL